jgi:hypothetical protein
MSGVPSGTTPISFIGVLLFFSCTMISRMAILIQIHKQIEIYTKASRDVSDDPNMNADLSIFVINRYIIFFMNLTLHYKACVSGYIRPGTNTSLIPIEKS